MTTGQVVGLLHDVLHGRAEVQGFKAVSESIVALDFADGTRAVLTVNVQQRVP